MDTWHVCEDTCQLLIVTSMSLASFVRIQRRVISILVGFLSLSVQTWLISINWPLGSFLWVKEVLQSFLAKLSSLSEDAWISEAGSVTINDLRPLSLPLSVHSLSPFPTQMFIQSYSLHNAVSYIMTFTDKAFYFLCCMPGPAVTLMMVTLTPGSGKSLVTINNALHYYLLTPRTSPVRAWSGLAGLVPADMAQSLRDCQAAHISHISLSPVTLWIKKTSI